MSKSLEAKVAAELMGKDEALKNVAIGKALSDAAYKGASNALPAGKHSVDVTIRIQGVITKGEDFDQQVVMKADAWTLLATAMSMLNGVSVEALVQKALSGEVDSEEVKERANKAVATIKGTTVSRCAGKVTSKLNVTTVEVK